ncbi:autophagy-related protein 16-1-like isoform X1 [Mytilus californianus]|uniref:autophagy-related protein 16-1-like isoform X1 n=1 Tax=Mytilus californianus TaxID=6549 RepID=UPI00224704F2|nr:autophagy-related protein 16-1-like isoform X1 [Mytilus californianus]
MKEMSTSEIDWKQNIFKQLKLRNKREKEPFENLIQSYSKNFDIASSLKSKNAQLTVEVDRLKEENTRLSEQSGANSPGFNDKSHSVDVQKLYKLQEELTELHKKRGENSQQIIDLNMLLQEKERELMIKDAKLHDTDAVVLALKSEIKNLEMTIVELEQTNQMLKDEHQALGLAFTAMEEKYRKIQDENADLITRWMHVKARDADKMNEDNDIQIKKRQAKLQKELIEAAKEPVEIRPESEAGVYVPGIVPLCLSVSLPNKAQHKFEAHDGEVNAIKWSPSGTLFATGGSDRKIKLWEISGGKCQSKGILTGSNQGIMALDFGIEENYILGASNDFASRVWSLTDQRLRSTLTGHSGKVLAAKFLGDCSKIVSGSHDRTLKIWDLTRIACIKTIFAGSSCNDLVTLQGSNIISGHFDKRLRFWDSRTDSSNTEIILQGRLTSLDLSTDRSQLLCCTRDDSLKVIDLRMNQVSSTLYADHFNVSCDWSRAVFSPDGSYAIAGSHDGSIFIWNIAKEKVERVLKEHNNAVVACAWHPSGQYVLSADKQKKAVLWSDI